MSSRYQAGIVLPGYNPLKVPNAPTIGTATAGISSVSVAFTAPSDVGGGAITGYSVQAIKTSDGSTTVATGASSPISVTGLAATAYTFKVFATNAYGPSPLSAASNSVTPLAVGDAYQGGYFAGQISTAGNGVADYNIVVGPFASANSASKQFKTTATATAGTASGIDGPANSAAMNNASHPAAQFCEAVTAGGYSDWYMPARYELEVCYYNLKPTTQGNTASSGGNPYSVPTRSGNYGPGDPAQTTAALFIVTTGAQAFEATTAYWSSTTGSSTGAWKRGFYSGYQYNSNKTYSYNVRAIRRVAV